MLVHHYACVGGSVGEGMDPFDGPPEVMAFIDSGQAEVGGLSRATAAAVDAITGSVVFISCESWGCE